MRIDSAPLAKDNAGHNAAWMIVGNLIAGIVIYGGLGWLISLWVGHRSILIAAGVLFGLATSTYLVHVRLKALDSDPHGRSDHSVGTKTVPDRPEVTGV